NGIGIGEEYHQSVFRNFFRLHGKSKYQGNGIGLAFVKKSIERIGGKIWVHSSGDFGTVFRFNIPKT
ncbi:MAG: ATP-binding protein, partial [Salibacteraceae bacterium]